MIPAAFSLPGKETEAKGKEGLGCSSESSIWFLKLPPFDRSGVLSRWPSEWPREAWKEPVVFPAARFQGEKQEPLPARLSAGTSSGPSPKGAPSPRSTAAARQFLRDERPPLTCGWRKRNSLFGVGPIHSDTELQRTMAAAAVVRVSAFRAGGCFTREGSQDSNAERLQFRLPAVPRTVPRLSAPRGGTCCPHRPEGASGREGNTGA